MFSYAQIIGREGGGGAAPPISDLIFINETHINKRVGLCLITKYGIRYIYPIFQEGTDFKALIMTKLINRFAKLNKFPPDLIILTAIINLTFFLPGRII